MDIIPTKNEVRLRKGTSHNERLILAGVGVVFCLFAIPDFVASSNGQWPVIGSALALLIGFAILARALLVRNVLWIITANGILIGEQRPFGKLHSRSIRGDEILEMHLRKDDADPTRFSLAFKASSGDELISPPLPDVTRVHQTTARIARLLALPDPEPADNPLDAINSEIRLGKPLERKRGAQNRVLIVLIACVLSLPFVLALWNGQLSHLGAIIWSLGVVFSVVLFRYAYQIIGDSWIIRDHEILVERLALNGTDEIQTIRGDDVDAMDVETNEGSHVLAIRLRVGKIIRSPSLDSREAANALRAEIMRRLNIPRFRKS